MALKPLGPWLFDRALVYMMVWPRNASGSHGRLKIYLDVSGAGNGRPALETDRAEPVWIAADYADIGIMATPPATASVLTGNSTPTPSPSALPTMDAKN